MQSSSFNACNLQNYINILNHRNQFKFIMRMASTKQSHCWKYSQISSKYVEIDEMKKSSIINHCKTHGLMGIWFFRRLFAVCIMQFINAFVFTRDSNRTLILYVKKSKSTQRQKRLKTKMKKHRIWITCKYKLSYNFIQPSPFFFFTFQNNFISILLLLLFYCLQFNLFSCTFALETE